MTKSPVKQTAGQDMGEVEEPWRDRCERPNHSVYDDDESVKFPPADPATRSSAKEDTANPKISEAVKRDHWILDNNSLVFTSRCIKALLTPTGVKECPAENVPHI